METSKPKQSYTIWFSQRTGSTLLYKALQSTGVAGNPGELLHMCEPETAGMPEIVRIWEEGSTPNGVFGMKVSMYHANHEGWLAAFRRAFNIGEDVPRSVVWETAFPNGKHIVMSRRNQVRLAVSWWRAIVSGEWHREHGQKPSNAEISGEYSFDAISHLLTETAMREAAIEDFLTEAGITPMTIVYEDFIANYERTVRDVLDYLGIDQEGVRIAEPYFDRIADEVAEQWVQRFREERQAGWTNRAW
ncbi:Stf0 family sulfotransferase [Paenibacillus silvisoli]|uniref:Stf0 family sulfotransferase n=1 Tax=Paenibacillus silvisoli TaxID=3110539 RepID=UPI0028045B6C|nr:Stf0 family sulfotransferase [Paenibacillus silvisoli]